MQSLEHGTRPQALTHQEHMTHSKKKNTVLKEYQIHDTAITATKNAGITTAPTDS